MPDRIRKQRFDDPAKQARAKPVKGRRLVIRGRTWIWSGVDRIRIHGPDGRDHRVCLTDFSGLDWNSLERMSWKRPAYEITPWRVVDYIDRRILGYTDRNGFPQGVIPDGWEADVPRGSRPVQGPRGTWHWWIEDRIAILQSPEGVRTWHRVHQFCGMSEKDFLEARIEAARDTRTDFDPTRTMDWIQECLRTPCDAAPDPVDAQVRDFIAGFASPLPAAA